MVVRVLSHDGGGGLQDQARWMRPLGEAQSDPLLWSGHAAV
jgi:hypothetical protein